MTDGDTLRERIVAAEVCVSEGELDRAEDALTDALSLARKQQHEVSADD